MDVPRAKLTKAQDLVLELDTKRVYRPGDTVCGMLKFKPKAQQSRSIVRSISLKIWGQTFMRSLDIGGIRTKTYLDHAFLFDQEVDLSEIYDSDSDFDVIREWKFQTTLPKYTDSSAVGYAWGTTSSSLNTCNRSLKQELPCTFAFGRSAGSLTFTHEAYVEYAFTATIELSEPGEERAATEQTTTVPFNIHVPGTEQPLIDFQVKKETRNFSTRSLYLISDKQETPLTFRQRLQTHLHLSKVPKYSCNVSVQYPTVIQLNNHTVPFVIHAEPDSSEANAISPTQFPSVKITSFSLSIRCTTHFHGRSSHHGENKSSRLNEHTIYDSRKRVNGTKEVDITLLPDTRASFDLGAHLGLAISRKEATCVYDHDEKPTTARASILVSQPSLPSSNPPFTRSPSSLPIRNHSVPSTSTTKATSPPLPRSTRIIPPLSPSFSTPSIAQTHQLHWILTVAVAGASELQVIEGLNDVKIVAEARCQMGVELGQCVGKAVGLDEKVLAERLGAF